MPEDSQPPRFWSPLPEVATGSYGFEVIEFAERNPQLHRRPISALRWWQQVYLLCALAHDADGRLVFRNWGLSTPRQVGKTTLVSTVHSWRLMHGARIFGEPQFLVSVAHRARTAAEAWMWPARWASSQKERFSVRFANGQEAVEQLEDGSRWAVVAPSEGAAIGLSLTQLTLDEAWMLSASMADAADPALAEAESPITWVVSTAGDYARSDFFLGRRTLALQLLDEPSNNFYCEWSAPGGASLDDRDAWRQASPVWSEKRLATVLDARLKMSDPEFGMAYLNKWGHIPTLNATPGLPMVTQEQWSRLNGVEAPPVPPVVVAVEGYFAEGVSTAAAWQLPGGRVFVQVRDHRTIAEAAATALGSQAPQVLVGKSLTQDPVWQTAAVEPTGSTTKEAVATIRQLLDADVLRHDGGEVLAEQVLAVRTAPSAEGLRLVSQGRSDGVKAAAWAAARARVAIEEPKIF